LIAVCLIASNTSLSVRLSYVSPFSPTLLTAVVSVTSCLIHAGNLAANVDRRIPLWIARPITPGECDTEMALLLLLKVGGPIEKIPHHQHNDLITPFVVVRLVQKGVLLPFRTALSSPGTKDPEEALPTTQGQSSQGRDSRQQSGTVGSTPDRWNEYRDPILGLMARETVSIGWTNDKR
jgi:hypothetical protein